MPKLLAVAALHGRVVEVLEEVAGCLLLHLWEEIFIFFDVFGAFILLLDLFLVVGANRFSDQALQAGRSVRIRFHLPSLLTLYILQRHMPAEIGVAFERATRSEQVGVPPWVQRRYIVELILVLVVILTTELLIGPRLIALRFFLHRSVFLLGGVLSLLVLDEEAGAGAARHGGPGCALFRRVPLLIDLPESLHLVLWWLVRLRLFRVVFLVRRGSVQILSKRCFGRGILPSFVVLLLILHTIFKYL
jgi:hypothetical protein